MSHLRIVTPRSPLGRLVAYGALLLAAASCDPNCIRGEDPPLDCDNTIVQYDDAVEEEGVLLDAIPDKASFPMAMVISEEGINRLLFGVVGDNVPFASVFPLGPVEMHFTPMNTPTIDLIDVPGCSRCAVFALDFSVEVLNPGGDPAGAGVGSAEVVIPLSLDVIEGDTTALVAHYEKATVRDLPLNALGFDTKNLPNFEAALEILVTEHLREQYGPTELIRFAPWTIGTNSVRLAAKQFAIFPETGVLSLALQTNLDLPESVNIEVGRALPQGVPMAVQMHPGLLFGMAERMLAEGVIPRRYDDKGNPDLKGKQGVTLNYLEKSNLGETNVDVGFRVWRTEGGDEGDYCGYVNAVSTLTLSLADEGLTDRITVTPTDDVRVIDGKGVGELYEDNQELVDDNKQLVESFKQSLADQIGVTVNYSDISVEGGKILFDALALTVAADSIDIFLDFILLEEEGP